MKNILWILVGLMTASLSHTVNAAGESNTAPVHIGVYDSRAVGYAYFWSATNQQKLKDTVAAAKAAEKSGDTKKFNELSSAMRTRQADMHRQVFSTAPATEALAVIKARLPEIQEETGVSALVSKWDENSLKQYHDAEQVDVTDQLVREFLQPDAKQKKVIESFKKTKPLSLEKCDELIREGKI